MYKSESLCVYFQLNYLEKQKQQIWLVSEEPIPERKNSFESKAREQLEQILVALC